MTPLSRRLRLVSTALSVIALAVTTQASAGWESSYQEGKAAYEAGEYGKTIRLMRAAIGDKGDEKANAIKTSGMFFEAYLPHFYLGMALSQRKDFKGAFDELNTSESMKVIPKFRDLYVQLKQTRSAAEAAMSAEAPPPVAEKPPPPVTPPPSRATTPEPVPSTKEPVKEPPKEVPKAVPMGPDPALTQALNAAAGDIAGALKLAVDNAKYLDDSEKRRLDTSVTELRGAQTASSAGSMRQELQKTVAELRLKAGARKKEEDDRLAEKKKEEDALAARMAQNRALSDAVGRATPVLQEAEGFLSENRPNLQPADAQRIQRLLESAKKSTSPDAVTRAATDLRSAVATARKSLDATRRASGTREAQGQYARGVQAYFEGRYDEALPALQQASSSLPKEAALKAFLGCAYYKKFLLTKETDATLKKEAEGEFRAALAADRGFTLDARYFPPKVIAFYKEVAGKR